MGASTRMPYSEAELKLLLSGASYDEFNAVFPGRRTRDAWRNKRQDLGIAGKGIDPDPDATMEAVEAFIRSKAASNPYDVDLDIGLSPRFEDAPETDEDWERLFDYLESANEQRSALNTSTKEVTWDAPVDGPIGIAFLSDIHAGAGGVEYKRFRSDLETIAQTEGLYGIINGDLVENTKPQAKSGTALYSSVFASPREQLEYIRRRLAIARGKWIVITQGNHDAWDYKHAGIDRLPDLCVELGTKYATESGATVTANIGSQRYTIVAKHDYTGKSRISKSNSGRRLWEEWPHIIENVNADVVALAHLHEPDLHETTKKGHLVTLLRSGSYKTIDPWAESHGYKPSYGVPIVIFYGDERGILPVTDFERGVRILRAERERWFELN